MNALLLGQIAGAMLWQAQFAVGVLAWVPEWAVRESLQRWQRVRVHRALRMASRTW